MSDPIVQWDAEVIDQVKVAEESFILSLRAPFIARTIQPGQFIQIRCNQRVGASLGTVPPQMRFGEEYGGQSIRMTLRDSPPTEVTQGEYGGQSLYDPLLPRPFSIYRVRERKILDILYEVVGRGTELLASAKKGMPLNIFGPLGNTFSYPPKGSTSILVGGGAGLAPFYDLAEALIDPRRGKQKKENVIVLLGARNRKRVFCEKAFKKLGVRFEVATDDGSYGFKGLVTELLERRLQATSNKRQATRLYACGPNPMLCVIAQISETTQIPCEVSIDAPMPCGYGICFGCAVKVKQHATSDKRQENGALYKLACMDGPIFDVKELVWE